DYRRAAVDHGGVTMGEVVYLPRGATENGLDFEAFDAVGVIHSERAGPPEGPSAPCRDYRCFWSLNFAISAEDFAATGGFDERYRGYGGEDTDFGRVVATNGLPIWWLRGARAYHQYHPHHMPPVHHLDSVLANAHAFMDKWGEPTMQHWLRAFVLMGLVEKSGGRWRKLRNPREADLALTRQQADQPYASSARVLEQLEAEAAPAL
ncbi:MAG: galactosyltransferase-related protein, partial [Erythrobacter sp.]|nr:galactosyltransferase-related protein [Erythrobacter sp.]